MVPVRRTDKGREISFACGAHRPVPVAGLLVKIEWVIARVIELERGRNWVGGCDHATAEFVSVIGYLGGADNRACASCRKFENLGRIGAFGWVRAEQLRDSFSEFFNFANGGARLLIKVYASARIEAPRIARLGGMWNSECVV